MSVDPTMLALFRSEVDTHAPSLTAGLAALHTAQSVPVPLDGIRSSIRALLSASRIVRVAPATKLLAALDACVHASAESNAPPTSSRLDAMERAVEGLVSLTGLLETGTDAELARGESKIAPLLQALESSAQEASGGPTTKEPPSEPEPSITPPKRKLPPKPLDPSMLALFCQEVTTHTETLTVGLLSLESQPGNPGLLDQLMRSAHSIKGAARVVGLDDVVALAHAMEDGFVAARKGERPVTAARVDQFLRANDLLERAGRLLASTPPEDLAVLAAPIQKLVPILRGESSPEEDAEPPTSPEGGTTQDAPAVRPLLRSPGSEDVPVSTAAFREFMELAGSLYVTTRRRSELAESLVRSQQRNGRALAAAERLEALVGTVGDPRVRALAQSLRESLDATTRELSETADSLSDDARRAEDTAERLHESLLRARMRPFSECATRLPRQVRDLAKSLGKRVALQIEGASTAIDRDILRALEAPLNHIVRNALDHGIEAPNERRKHGKPEAGTIVVEAYHRDGQLAIDVRDDGRGIDRERLRAKIVRESRLSKGVVALLSDEELLAFLLLPGFTTKTEVSEFSGRGVGLDVVHEMVQSVQGDVRLTSREGQGTSVHLRLPVTLSVVRALIIRIAGEAYALRLGQVGRCHKVAHRDLDTSNGRATLTGEDNAMPIAHATELLGDPPRSPMANTDGGEQWLVSLGQGDERFALAVDDVVRECELVVRPLDERLGQVPCVSACAITDEGETALFLDVPDLVIAARQASNASQPVPLGDAAKERTRVLVVDDSATVRSAEESLLTQNGFRVDTAVDGVDAWHALRAGDYDLMITDVDMPRQNGLELTRRVRADASLRGLPVLMVSYKNRPEDRQRGMDAGADRYLTKDSVCDEALLQAVREVLDSGTVEKREDVPQ